MFRHDLKKSIHTLTSLVELNAKWACSEGGGLGKACRIWYIDIPIEYIVCMFVCVFSLKSVPVRN